MKAFVDKDTCISCGLCTEICPSVFKIGDDGHSEVYAPISKALEGCTLEAKDNCPVGAISAE